MSLSYLDTPERWRALAKVCTGRPTGLDTEYYTLDGTDPRAGTTIQRTRVHIWSVCVEVDGEYHTAVLPAAALECPELVAWLQDPDSPKYLHNEPVDDHTLGNHGIRLAGAVDTLLRSRARLPQRHFGGGYALKDMAVAYLQADDPVLFSDIATRPVVKEVRKVKKVKACLCGAQGCRKKKPPEDHVKEVRELVTVERKVLKSREPLPIQTLLPGLPHTCGTKTPDKPSSRNGEGPWGVCMACKWLILLVYSGNDALFALRLALEVLSTEGHTYGHDQPSPDPVPKRPR